jgi:hypothetical protein
MAVKTGVPTLIQVAQRMCQLINAFAPIIRRVYPDNTALHVALETAQAACMVLHNELEDVRQVAS